MKIYIDSEKLRAAIAESMSDISSFCSRVTNIIGKHNNLEIQLVVTKEETTNDLSGLPICIHVKEEITF